ncbi:hypothetical protein GGX14DRAFT_461800 [Mycena pura]|uniref:F-box domain-containing protein n=1 Tax=Mycena pura TaxID=153505 RepID=A0AAD6V7Q8_9AGAR|nr:hypothetical protein GGX14DRAFT_461800 [Mycena pura]
MQDLPLELISSILGLLGRSDIGAVRGANKFLHALATPRAFESLTVIDTVASAQGFSRLQSIPDIAKCVQSVVFQPASSRPRSTFSYQVPLFAGSAFTEADSNKRAAVPLAFTALYKLPHLKSLRFVFHDVCKHHLGKHHLSMQYAILKAAFSAPLPSLKSLTLKHLSCVPSALCESWAFEDFILPLESLSIDVDTFSLLLREEDSDVRELGEFWARMTPILYASQSVTTLHLESNVPIMIVEFPTTALPHLTSLSLARLFFNTQDEPGCPESFILLHRGHLARLTLEDCPLYGRNRVWARPWAVVLAGLKSQMLALRSIAVTGLQYAYEDSDPGRGCRTSDAEVVGVDGTTDKNELRALLTEVQR